ncbi:MAG: hypothetical protein AB2827_12365 [Candidatus Thiodiazotropha sp.]
MNNPLSKVRLFDTKDDCDVGISKYRYQELKNILRTLRVESPTVTPPIALKITICISTAFQELVPLKHWCKVTDESPLIIEALRSNMAPLLSSREPSLSDDKRRPLIGDKENVVSGNKPRNGKRRKLTISGLDKLLNTDGYRDPGDLGEPLHYYGQNLPKLPN